jgi:hypothetical protein
MTMTAPSCQAAQRFTGLASPGDEGLHQAAVKALELSGYSALRRLRCEVSEAVVVVHGVVPSWFLKQMAQVLLLRLDGVRGVANRVSVRGTDGDA